ncbi:MAG: hypothetical protein II418_06145, partial [Firmicutes bacterium]|nr:hypothetical protein [Bacillota bacterium]
MKKIVKKSLTLVLSTALLVSSFTATAFADSGKGHGNNNGNGYGHEYNKDWFENGHDNRDKGKDKDNKENKPGYHYEGVYCNDPILDYYLRLIFGDWDYGKDQNQQEEPAPVQETETPAVEEQIVENNEENIEEN